MQLNPADFNRDHLLELLRPQEDARSLLKRVYAEPVRCGALAWQSCASNWQGQSLIDMMTEWSHLTSFTERSAHAGVPLLDRAHACRRGNVVLIAGQPQSGKTLLCMLACIGFVLPATWKGVALGGLNSALPHAAPALATLLTVRRVVKT